jgi:hypothetical protein
MDVCRSGVDRRGWLMKRLMKCAVGAIAGRLKRGGWPDDMVQAVRVK